MIKFQDMLQTKLNRVSGPLTELASCKLFVTAAHLGGTFSMEGGIDKLPVP